MHTISERTQKRLNRKLLEAAQEGNARKIRELLKQGGPKRTLRMNWTPPPFIMQPGGGT